MPLADELADTVAHLKGVLPDQIFADIAQSTAALSATGIAGRAPRPGAVPVLPTLPDEAGQPVDLAALAARRPLVLTFYRGGWCPYCNVALRALAAALAQLQAAGAGLVAVTPERPDRIAGSAARAAAGFPILHDAYNDFARSLGLVFDVDQVVRGHFATLGIDLPASNGDASFTLPVPATFVIGRDGVITWAFVDANFTRRAEPADILAAVRALPMH